MITIKDFMEVTNFRITEGSEYLWKCFGPGAYRLDSWSGAWDNSTEGYTISIVFDTQTQEVYQAEAYDYVRNRVYRLQAPEYVAAHVAEAAERRIDPNEALTNDDGTPVKYIDLTVDGDWLEKVIAIVNGEEYDTRVQLEVEFTDQELLQYMTLAHKLDLTFNQLVELALIEKLNELKKAENV